MVRSSTTLPNLGEHSGATLKGKYQLGERLADSPRAEIYLAEDLHEHREVAVKIPRLGGLHRPEALARFKLEVEIVRRLAHPHVVRVYDGDELPGGGPYLAMEHLQGETLAARLRRVGRLPVPDSVRILSQIGAALSAIHRHSIVHRDVRPQKVFLVSAPDTPEVVKVLDFGMCSVRGGVAFHTGDATLRAYQAPELARAGAVADHRVDVFAMGVMAYELVTGQNPFVALVPGDTGRAMFRTPPAPSKLCAEVPSPLDRVILRALELEPNKRDASVSRFVAALESASAGSTTRQRRVRGTTTDPRGRSAAAVLLHAARAAFVDGRLDDAVAAAEQIWEHAALGADPEYQRLIATSLPLLQRIFFERIGPRNRRIGVGPAGHDLEASPFTPKACELIRLAEAETSVEQLIAASGMPPRDAERMIAGLLRRRALVMF